METPRGKKIKANDNEEQERDFTKKAEVKFVGNLQPLQVSVPLEAKLDQETQHLIKILPEDVWLLVIDQFADSPKDLEKLNNASPYFRELLLPKKVFSLFHQVLKVALPHLLFKEIKYSPMGFTSKRVDEISTILNCRTVCSRWRNSVDNFIQDAHNSGASPISSNNDYRGHVMFLIDKTKTEFDLCGTGKELKLFLKHFEESHPANSQQSPFVSGTVRIIAEPRNEYYPYDPKHILNILEKYGSHFTKLELFLPDELPCLQMRTLLLPLRNLKCLKVQMELSDWDRPTFSTQQAEDDARQHPLPNLSELETLEADSLLVPIFKELFRNCENIFTLVLRCVEGDYEICDIFPGSHQNLKSLKIYSINEWIVEDLRKCQDLAVWPLTCLEIHQDTAVYVPFSSIFELIQDKWSSTLTRLSLLMPEAGWGCGKDSFQFRIKCPNLRHCQLTMNHTAHLDFLLGSKDSLEELNLEFCGIGWSDDPESDCGPIPILEIIGFEHRMYQSNIWTLFPKLTKMSARGTYTRKDWLKQQKLNKNN